MSERQERIEFINSLMPFVGSRYLEIGVGTGEHFKSINTLHKAGVDISDSSGATFVMTSDEYFKSHCLYTFDIIFIDGDHRCEQVVKDFNNAIKHLSDNGIILVHDLVPRDETYITPAGCGDGFKMLTYFVASGNKDMFTIKETLGLTCFYSKCTADLRDISYGYFESGVKPLINFVSYNEAIDIIKDKVYYV